MTKRPAHQNLETLLQDNSVEYSASEIHGMLIGLIAASGNPSFIFWIKEFIDLDHAKEPGIAAILEQLAGLHLSTVQMMDASSFELQLLLPDDRTTLAARTQALADLSRGLLFGIAAGGINADADLSEDSQEIIQDLTDLCHISETGSEEDEDAFIELSDYLAVAVKLLHAELRPKHIKNETVH